MRMLLRSSLPLVLIALTACAGNSRPAYDVPVEFRDLTTAQVRNQNPYAVTIYLRQPGLKHRLGTVESLSSTVFLVPPRLLESRPDFRLVAEATGPHPTQVSERFVLRPGQVAGWQVHERSAHTTLVSVN